MGSCPAVSSLKTLLYMVNLYINTQTPSDLASPGTLKSNEHYDFIIVGGGSAGCVVANRLSEVSNWTVLLLEAGGEEPFSQDIPGFYNYETTTRLNWLYRTEPQENSCGGKSCTWRSGKTLGGGSSLNGMIYNRGSRHDYDNWEKQGNPGWGYKDVLYYYKKSENNLDPDIANDTMYHSVGGYQSVSRFPYQDDAVKALYEGFLELNYPAVDINGENTTGAMIAQTTSRNGKRVGSNRAFLDPIRKERSNLKIVTNVRATKLLTRSDKGTIYGVEYASELDRSVTGKVFSNKEVIVSAGAVMTPQLLLLSGIGPKEVLEPLGIPVLKDLKVGQNLQTHPSTVPIYYNVGNSTEPDSDLILSDALQYLQPKRGGPWSATSVTQVTLNFNSRLANPSIDFPDLQYYMSTDLVNTECPADLKVPPCYYNRLGLMPNILRPKSFGKVTINSTDPFEGPLIYPGYFTDPHDKDLIIDGSNVATKLADTQIFRRMGYTLDKTPTEGCADLEYGSDEYWVCAATTNSGSFMFHQSSSCKMGPSSDPTAVVNSMLEVHGMKGLSIADTSIMPDIVSGNTNAPAMMIGEKASDMIKKRWSEL